MSSSDPCAIAEPQQDVSGQNRAAVVGVLGQRGGSGGGPKAHQAADLRLIDGSLDTHGQILQLPEILQTNT